MELNTFSICGRCDRTGQLGVAVATAVQSVGDLVPYIHPKVGAIANQASLNPALGSIGLQSLVDGKNAQDSLSDVLSSDNGKSYRQIGIVDNDGNSAAWTGEDCQDWAGHLKGHNISVQGNLLESEDTIINMYDVFQNTDDLDLKERLMMSLEIGQEYGGDKRGGDRQSAALIVYSNKKHPLVDFRVNKHHSPVAELRKNFN
jgi:uncharacterized Ntn-hydrolase superfamily protein|tara:strand:- start:39 stop:644 length:606 start_codon:yes stop_codon:yes gene_type:complete